MTAETKTKRTEYERYKVRADAMLAEYPNGLPGAKAGEFDTLMTKMSEIKAEILESEAAEDRKVALSEADRFLNDPVRRVPHGINGDDDDRKSLERAGWEFKGGMAYAPTSSGKTHEMFTEDVLFGAIPDDPASAEFYRKTRAAMSPEYRVAYAKWYQEYVKSGHSEAMAYNRLSPSEQKALSEGTDTAGGFTVPPDVQGELLARTAQQAVMRRLARVQTTNRDILRWPMLSAASATAGGLASGGGSIFSSGFVGSWAAEVPSGTETDAGFQMFDVPIKKIRIIGKFSNDLLMDSAFNLLAALATDGAQNMALVEDLGFINGSGAGYQPLGLLSGGFTTFDVEGTTSNTISNTTSSSGSAAKIIAGTYLIPDQYVAGSVMLMSRTIEGTVAALVDGNGRPFWPANAGGGFDLPRHQVEGLPVSNSSFMPGDGTDANKVMFTGNLAQAYIIGQRAQVTSTVLRERYADTDQTGIVIFERVGGAVWNTDAGRIGIV
jgi:HK97 family phage major capsid protein